MRLQPKREAERAHALDLRLRGLTYQAIADDIGGISRQRIQQWLRPKKATYDVVWNRADGKCECCGIIIGGNQRGDIHHKQYLEDGQWNGTENLQLLCASCHQRAHQHRLQRRPNIAEAPTVISPEIYIDGMVNLRDMITLSEAARRLHVVRPTLYRWIERYHVPVLRVGNMPYVSLADIEDLAERRRNQSSLT